MKQRMFKNIPGCIIIFVVLLRERRNLFVSMKAIRDIYPEHHIRSRVVAQVQEDNYHKKAKFQAGGKATHTPPIANISLSMRIGEVD